MHPVPCYGQDYEKQKGPGTNNQALSGLQNMSRTISFLVIYHLGNFENLTQSGFWVIPQILFAKLWKPIYDVIIIQISFVSLNLETVEVFQLSKIKAKQLRWKQKCGALRDLVPFVQFKKREKHPWRSVLLPQIPFWQKKIESLEINLFKNK